MENFENIPSFPDAETPDALSEQLPQESALESLTPQPDTASESSPQDAAPESLSQPDSASEPSPPSQNDAPELPSQPDNVTESDAAPELPPQPDNVTQVDAAPENPVLPDSPEYVAPRSASHPPRRARKKRSRRWLWGFLCGMAVAGLLAVGARLWEQRHAPAVDRFVWNFRENEETVNQDLGIHIETWPVGQGPVFTLLREHGETLSAQEIYRDVNPSVVTVIVEISDNTAAVGTGVIFSPDGYFVTNYHVIQGGSQCRAMLDSGRSYPALYVAGDEQNDLAVLKMDTSDPLPAAQFGDSERLTVGDDVYAIGNPLGIEFRGTLTNGIISAIDRDVLVDGRTMTLLQTNAALNSGNSGGPLINEYGQVIGINVVKMSSRRSTVEGLGFAIPSAAMERLVNDLLTYGESQPEPVIGVSVDSFGTEVAPDLWGIGVLKVEEDSPAEKAGIQVGDYIIGADDETVSSSRDLLRVRRRYHVGDSMSLTLWRDGERVETVLTFTDTW